MAFNREGDTRMHQLATSDEQWTTLSNLYDQVYKSMHVKHEITNESALAIMNAIEAEMAKLEKPKQEGYINDDDLAG